MSGKAAAPGMRFREGDRIEHYIIEKSFDPGAYTNVGKARCTRSNRPVFLKKYRNPTQLVSWYEPYLKYQDEIKSRIEKHQAAKDLCYEMIHFFEVKSATNRAYYQIFEWVEGGSDLSKVIDKIKSGSGEFSWQQRVTFAKVLMAGIRAIHDAAVIHTDLKPENCYMLPEPNIAAKYKLRLIDFDNSLIDGKKAPWDGPSDGQGYVGTPGYFSPEHIQGKVPLKPSDVFTCGIILSEILTGNHPAHGKDNYDKLALGKDGGLKKIKLPEPVKEEPNTEFLEFVLNECFNLDPAKRPSAESVLLALNGKLPTFNGRNRSGGGARPSSSSDSPPVLPPKLEPVIKPKSIAPPVKSAGIFLNNEGGSGRLEVGISPVILGKTTFESWGPDFERFMAPKQFTLIKSAAGHWTIRHHPEAKNITNLDGNPLVGDSPLRPGSIISLGKSERCKIKVG